MHDYFRIGLGGEFIAEPLQLFSQFFVVFDNAVVHHRQRACGIGVGVGVLVIGNAVGSPSGVTDTHASLGSFVVEQRFQIGKLAGRFQDAQSAFFNNSHTG